MLQIENTQVFNLNSAIKASQYPTTLRLGNTAEADVETVTEQDMKRAIRLAHLSGGHDNFLSGILVSFDIIYPLYWAPEFQRYHFAQIVSSQSTMHSLMSLAQKNFKEFATYFNKYVDTRILETVYSLLKEYAEKEETLTEEEHYNYFMRIRSNLPSGFEMKMHVVTNYLQLKTMYFQRKNHKLKEDWGTFVKWIEELPLFRTLVL